MGNSYAILEQVQIIDPGTVERAEIDRPTTGVVEHSLPVERRAIERGSWYLVCAGAGRGIVGQLVHASRTTFLIGSAAGLAVADIIWRYVRQR
jgi:hypothetical protein